MKIAVIAINYYVFITGYKESMLEQYESQGHVLTDIAVHATGEASEDYMNGVFDKEHLIEEAEGHGFATLIKPVTPSIMLHTLQKIFGHVTTVSKLDGEQSEGANIALLTGRCVLLVEDTPFNQEIALEYLSQAGVQVSIAQNGEEALKVLREDAGRFDAVLMDVQMPVMYGFEATR
ncbi:MAG: response regulator, partial [Exilibacterium sp.]